MTMQNYLNNQIPKVKMTMQHYLNKQVGFVQVNKPIVYVNNNYECAAWWEERTSKTGVYPLFLKKRNGYSADFIVVAEIPGTITDDYFPALWGGVPVSNKPYTPKYVGRESQPIPVSADLSKAIDDTGNSPGRDIDWYINPELWTIFLKNREEELNKVYADLPNWWKEYQSGDDQFHSRVGMVAHIAEYIVQYGREIQELYSKIEHIKSWQHLYEKNTAWIHNG
jgi:hypothetical protein